MKHSTSGEPIMSDADKFFTWLRNGAEIDAAVHVRVVMLAAAFSLWLLIAFSAPLWLGGHDYPQVPLVRWGAAVPLWLEWLCLVEMLFALFFACATNGRWAQLGKIAFLVSAAILVCADQHRLQPWLYHVVLLTVFFALLKSTEFIRLSRWLLISIYLFSAASKMDYLFAQTIGQQFLFTLATFLGLDANGLDPEMRAWLTLLFPALELLVAIGLSFRRCRRNSAYVAIAMHLALMAILGPWGLEHHAGVFIWNGVFVVHVWMLFLLRDECADSERLAWSKSFKLCCVFLVLPIFETLGYFDHWPAWQLYAPRNSRVAVEILGEATGELPAELKTFASSDPALWQKLDIGKWSFAETWVPVYPEDRYQVGVALAVAERYRLEGRIRVHVQSTSDRRTGVRQSATLRGTDEIRDFAVQRFWMNAIPSD